MKRPRCKVCRTKGKPLRWRELFDGWFCPRCEYAHAQRAVDKILKELGMK